MLWKLIEFIWRRKNINHEWDPFIEALKDISIEFNNNHIRNCTFTEVINEI